MPLKNTAAPTPPLESRDDIDDIEALVERPTSLVGPRYESMLNQPQCAGVKRDGDRCLMNAVPGSQLCRMHGGGVAASARATRERLLQAVGPAIDVLSEAMVHADWPTACRAATAILDRAGVGPHSHVSVHEAPALDDIEKLDDEQLEQRALTLANMIRLRRLALAEKTLAIADNDPMVTLEAEVVSSDGGVTDEVSRPTKRDPHHHDPIKNVDVRKVH